MKPCNDIEETHAQEFIDELTVLANMVCTKIINYMIKADIKKRNISSLYLYCDRL